MQTKIAPSTQILASNIGDEIVMMSIDEGKYFSLKGPSGRLWELLQEGTDIKSIHIALMSEYDVSSQQCEDEIFALINKLLDNRLIFVQT